MSPAQLAVLLEMLPGPARVYDASGAIIAQNTLARGHGDRDDDWKIGARRELGESWHLQAWVAERRGSDPGALGAERRATHSIAHNADLSTLANSMAHSIRNPLSSIVTAAGLVQDDEGVSEETALLLDVIKKESRQLNRILTDFLDYVRPRPFQLVRLDAAAAARRTVAALRRDDVLGQSIEVVDALPSGLMVWGDEAQLGQALRNIMLNAAEAMPDGGALRLSGETMRDAAILGIEDSGPGFSPEDLRRAFEPFYSNTSQGAGLGLAIACAAIERSGGRVWIENIEGGESAGQAGASGQTNAARGARVRIELPLTAMPATP